MGSSGWRGGSDSFELRNPPSRNRSIWLLLNVKQPDQVKRGALPHWKLGNSAALVTRKNSHGDRVDCPYGGTDTSHTSVNVEGRYFHAYCALRTPKDS